MIEQTAEIQYHDRVGRVIAYLCSQLGMIGGILMVAAMITLVSHVVCNIFGAPILGANEIVEQLIGASIFCFLAPCQIKGANIVVDYFSKPLPVWLRRTFDVVVTLLFGTIAVVLTWRIGVGGISAFMRNQQSMFLGLPKWPGYAIAFIACFIWTLAIFYTAWTALRVARGLAVAGRESVDGQI